MVIVVVPGEDMVPEQEVQDEAEAAPDRREAGSSEGACEGRQASPVPSPPSTILLLPYHMPCPPSAFSNPAETSRRSREELIFVECLP